MRVLELLLFHQDNINKVNGDINEMTIESAINKSLIIT